MIKRVVLGMAAAATAALVVRRAAQPRPAPGTHSGNGDAPHGPHDGHIQPAPGPADTHQPDRDGTRRLIGIITHELRTPTSVILGYQELLSEGLLGPVNDRARDALDRIRRAAGQLRDLTDGLQILTGDLPERYSPGNSAPIADAARRAVDLARPDAEARGAAIHLAIDGDPLAAADPDALERLLDLLLAASIRARHDGAIQFLVTHHDNTVTAETRGVRFDGLEGHPHPAEPDTIDSPFALRLAIARRIASSLGGQLLASPDALRLLLPAAPRR